MSAKPAARGGALLRLREAAQGGAGAGLLLPLVGQGALALAPEAVAQIAVVPAGLPFSSEALALRQIRREFHALRQEERGLHRTLRWADLWVNRYCPAQHQLMGKPVTAGRTASSLPRHAGRVWHASTGAMLRMGVSG